MTMDWGSAAPVVPLNYEEYLGPAMFAPLSRVTADVVEAGPGDVALDVACGTGILTRELARRLGERGRVTGLDLGEGMLAIARDHNAPGAAIEYVRGGADQLPFGDGEFTIVTCQQGLQFFPDRPAALAEIRRVLAPAGRVAVACWGATFEHAGWALIAAALDRHYGRGVGDMLRAPFRLCDPAELRLLLEEAGFGSVVVEIERVAARFPDPEHFALRVISAGPVFTAFSAGTAEQQAAVTSDVAAALEPYRDGDTVAFEMPSLLGVAHG